MDLDERKAAILRAIVEEHIATAQPVGSQTVARSGRLGVSSATVRNEMTILEREGFIAQPHTSAGRIPTDRGYRFFVDTLTPQSTLPLDQRREVRDFFDLFSSAHQVLEDLLHETSQLLSRVSTHTAVVVGPHTDTVTIRTVQLVSLQPTLVLALAILSTGAVEKCVLHLAADVDDATLQAAANALASLEGARWPVKAEPLVASTPAAADLAREARDAFVARGEHDVTDPLYVGGASRLAASGEGAVGPSNTARLLELLEHQVEVVSLVRDLLDEQGSRVSIGSENPLDELRDCSIVVAPYTVDGEVAGTVGVLGPTRMDYRQALAAVEAISEQLGRVLR